MAAEPLRPQTGAGMSLDERTEIGRAARKKAPRSSHADWQPPAGRPDPLEVLTKQDRGRVDFLVPIRHRRMGVSAFTFYRGTAAIMAADLEESAASGIHTQICGDAHLSNFGAFASPERELVIDVNDFDETLVGPWEWDLKRLAASLVLAGRDLGLSAKHARAAARTSARRYQKAMREFSRMPTLQLWYDHVTAEDIRAHIGSGGHGKRFERGVRKARRRTSLRSFRRLGEMVDGRPRLRSDPPLLIPFRDLVGDYAPGDWEQRVRDSYEEYQSTLTDEVRALLSRYEMVDVALKVVGVGSVGTRCFVALMIGRDDRDPLLLQVKEAGPSVLSEALGPSSYDNQGRRVVEGQRLMQAFGDTMLGWSSAAETERDFYWRQLKDMKGSAEIETMDEEFLVGYAGICGWTLARAHARAGDPVAIAAYIGKSDTFANAITRFAELYADRAEADYRRFSEAMRSGELDSAAPAESPVQS
jgi:uncharacterized protein (DUF2252 family)